MLRALYADIGRLLKSKYFKVGMMAVPIIQLLYLLLIYLLMSLWIKESMKAEDVASWFSGTALIWMAAFTLLLTEREFSDGCIRNKIISGVKRWEACLSAVLVGMLQGLMYSLMACLSFLAVSAVFFGGFTELSPSEIANDWLVIILSCIAVGAFSTALIMIFGGKKLSYFLGLALAVGYPSFHSRVLEQLYPESGPCTLSGAKLAIYEFIDKYIPYSYLTTAPRHPQWVYWVGCTGLIILSMLAGIGVFHKKELS